MAVQQGNIQCVQGAYGEPTFEELDEIFYIVKPNSIFQMFMFDLLNMNKNFKNITKKKSRGEMICIDPTWLHYLGERLV